MFLAARARQLRSALIDAWPICLAAIGIGSALSVGWCASSSNEVRLRIAGMILQLLGLATVAVGLSQLRRRFKRPSVLEKIVAWLRRVGAVFARPKSVTVHAGTVLSGVTLAGAGRVRQTLAPDAPHERRLSLLEDNLELLQKQVDDGLEQLHGRIQQLGTQIDRDAHERRREKEQAEQLVAEVAVGGLHLEVVGLLWLALGVIGTSMPTEIASWFAWLP